MSQNAIKLHRDVPSIWGTGHLTSRHLTSYFSFWEIKCRRTKFRIQNPLQASPGIADGQIGAFHFRAKHERAEGERGLSAGEQGASGCRRRRQTGAPSELRSKTYLVSCQMGVSWVRVMVRVRIRS